MYIGEKTGNTNCPEKVQTVLIPVARKKKKKHPFICLPTGGLRIGWW